MRLRPVAPAALLAMLALAGCSAGSSGASSSATPTAAPSAPSATAPSATSNGDAMTSTSIQSQADRGHGKHAPPSVAAGLRHSTGYGTYELCQGTCVGSVPAALRRPLHLPGDDGGPCPITLHAVGPVAPREISAGVGFHRVSGSRWLAASVTWMAGAAYTGPVLIRGAMLGQGALGFGTGVTPYDELQLMDAGRGAPRVARGRAWVTTTRIRDGGCYAYQVDGASFSDVVVFRAVG